MLLSRNADIPTIWSEVRSCEVDLIMRETNRVLRALQTERFNGGCGTRGRAGADVHYISRILTRSCRHIDVELNDSGHGLMMTGASRASSILETRVPRSDGCRF